MKTRVIIMLLLAIVAISNASRIYHVSIFGSDDNNGLTSEAAFRTVKKAYNAAAESGDVIRIAAGVYQGNDNCLVFKSKNVTLIGPAKFQCNHGIRIQGVNFKAINLTFTNISISTADNVTFQNVKLSRGISAHNVQLLNLSSVYFLQGVVISTTGSDLVCEGCSGIGSGLISIRKGGIKCVGCNLPLFLVNATKPTSIILSDSSFNGIYVQKLESKKNPMNLMNLGICNITKANVSCEDSGYSGITLIASNCTVINSTVGNCTTGNYTNYGVGIHMESSNSTFYNVTVENNTGNSTIYVGSGSNFTMVNGSVSNNWGNDTTNGTGVFVAPSAVADVRYSTFQNNIGYHGAAIFVDESAEVSIIGSTLSNNRAHIAGGIGCRSRPRSLVLDDNAIRDNHSNIVKSACFD